MGSMFLCWFEIAMKTKVQSWIWVFSYELNFVLFSTTCSPLDPSRATVECFLYSFSDEKHYCWRTSVIIRLVKD